MLFSIEVPSLTKIFIYDLQEKYSVEFLFKEKDKELSFKVIFQWTAALLWFSRQPLNMDALDI